MVLANRLMGFAVGLGLLLQPVAVPAQQPPENNRAGDPVPATDIEKLVGRRCLGCHSGSEPAGEIDLTRPSTVARSPNGNADLETSLLWQVIRDDLMPPDNSLSDPERETIRQWIEAGAPGEFEPINLFRFSTDQRAGYDWWSLQPIRPVAPPTTDFGRSKNPVDAFIVDRLDRHSLTLSPIAEPRHQIRRVYLDLTGLPPPPEIIRGFEREPTDAAYAKIVDELLDSPEYGERWARHWMDIVRYGESDGFERNGPRRDAWRYRDWVIDALNRDMPFDEFARRQIAGDVLCEDPVEGMAATGFLVAGLHNTVVGSSKQMQLSARQDELEDLVGTIGQTFVGLTFNCARCHDHKFDPISQREYYQLTATVAGVTHGSRQARSAGDQRRLDSLASRIDDISAAIAGLEKPTRLAILNERRAGTLEPPAAPEPVLEWMFAGNSESGKDSRQVQLLGDARLTANGLELDGEGDFAETAPLEMDLNEKTLEAWVCLDGLDQRGGAAVSIETPDGGVFDAIVFGEQEPKRWMSGSNSFARTASFGGDAEVPGDRPIQMTIVYFADGTISAFRNGVPWGKAYRKNGPQPFSANQSRLLFGLRHSPPTAGRFLKGTIVQAKLYDRALTPDEVAASAGIETDYVSENELANRLPANEAERRRELLGEKAFLAAEKKQLESLSLVTVYTAVSSAPGETRFLPRGDVMVPGEVVKPGATAAVAHLDPALDIPPSANESQRRVKLAEWLTDDANPLFARVLANRLWHYHFGRGLVETPNDFGFNGGRPSHPELLDWLAAELQKKDYRLKPMHRTIVTSAVYRQSSLLREDPIQADSDNRWLWRRSPGRLDAEVVRDSLLQFGGVLNPERGGPGYDDVKIIDNNNGTTYYESFDSDDPALNRRTIYRFTPRGGRSALLDSLDCPDPSAATPRRSVTSTPLQALSLLNSDFVIRTSGDFASRAEGKFSGETGRQIDWMFREVLGRAPDAAEMSAARDLAGKYGLPAVARALFNSNEFMIVQ